MSTVMEAPKKSELPRPILFPLEVGLPCLFYPRGERLGDPKPCVMLRRESVDVVHLVEFRGGQNVEHACVRHVDDQHLDAHPKARLATGYGNTNGGAWDYVRGFRYDFIVPGYAVPVDDIDGPTTAMVLHLANLGWAPDLIAGNVRKAGLKKDLIETLIAAQKVGR